MIKAPRTMRKRLFVFCDGTWQDGVNKKQALTNVGTLARCLEGVVDDNYLQIVYYDSGVGNGTGCITRGIDGATGRGIAAKIRNAYGFLAHNLTWEDQSGGTDDKSCDEIILVGFSRGAFTVQCLASLISHVGLLRANCLYYLRGLFTLWANRHFTRVCHGQEQPIQSALEEHVRMFVAEGITQKVKIKACAVWDTVSSLGLPTPWPRPLSHVGSTVPEAVQNAFHALALDETRETFKPCTWKSKEHPSTFVRQCWFLGSHSDVGGSGDAALGTVTLVWMIGLLQARTGTKFNWDEIGKHTGHKFLEWDFDVNRFLSHFRQKSILSMRADSGQTTKSSVLWWFLGVKRRNVVPEAVQGDTSLAVYTSAHFTVRLIMATDPSRGRVLKRWKTVMQDDGCVHWERLGDVIPEDRLTKDDVVTKHEFTILKTWCDDGFAQQTDRTRFATRVRALIQDPLDGSNARLRSFVALLRENLRFEGNRLAPHRMYEFEP